VWLASIRAPKGRQYAYPNTNAFAPYLLVERNASRDGREAASDGSTLTFAGDAPEALGDSIIATRLLGWYDPLKDPKQESPRHQKTGPSSLM
jgi:hypothetical protein